jgi:glycosyltransferase involved in cell wall biosynthesis
MNCGEDSGVGVSVIIPAYNYAHFLRDAVLSALRQDWSPLEVLVVDDGSTDDTEAVLRSVQEPRLRVIRQTNAGLSAARNTGIREAKYPLLAFLDADDRWESGFLKKIAGCLAAAPSSVALAASGWQRITRDGQLVEQPKRISPPPSVLTARDFILRNRVFPSAVVARKAVFTECGDFDTTLRSSEDRDMWIRMTAKHQARYIDEPLVHIRRHGENMSKNAARMRLNTARTLGKAWKAGTVSRMNLPFWAKTRAVFEYSSAWTHFSAGERGKALLYLAYSFALCPLFLRPSEVSEQPLFRLRALRNFLVAKAESPQLSPIPGAK